MTGNTRFRKLLEPGYLGSVHTRNRILKMGAHPGFFPYQDGHIQPQLIDYYEALSRGGAGIVTVGGAPIGVLPGKGYLIHDEKYVPGMSRLAEAIRKHGCPAFLQIFHIGPMLPADAGVPTVAASSLSISEIPIKSMSLPREASIPEIKEIVQKFVEDTERAKKAGFQGVEINAACNHFLNTFLSRAWNKRQDEYGTDSLENRARILVEIIQGIKQRNGEDFAIVALINGAEPGLEKGTTSEESQGFAKILQAAGADAIHIRVEFYSKPKDITLRGSTHFPDIALYPEVPYPVENIDTSRHGAGGWVPLAAAVKREVSIPVIAVGRVDPELAERLLRRGMIDFVNFNRRLMADHDLPNKLAEGRYDDITPCTACMTCFNQVELGLPPKCQVNAALGKEKEYEIKAAEKIKKVMVVGGGPAGMEAARVAAWRGHQVILYEKENKLGGVMNLAAVVKGCDREDPLSLVRYLKTQITKLGVDVRLGKEVDRSIIEEVKPDVLILATGGTHAVPNIPGINKRNVLSSQALHHQLKGYLRFIGPRLLRRLTAIWMPVGKRVVIMGGNIQGCQTAEFLVKRGRKVTIVDTAESIGDGLLEYLVKPHLLQWLDEKGVVTIPKVKYEEVTDKGLTITTEGGEKKTIEADTVLTALPLQPNTELLQSLEGAVSEIHAIGDCREPHLTVDAIADGSGIARAI